ncbi:MAG: NFACT family protein [Candidatus Micrarchaeota archaeon]
MPDIARTMSNWEYSLVLKEAGPLLEGRHVRKIYQPEEDMLRIDIGKESLMVGAGAFFYLARSPPAGPVEPGAFAMLLRKHLEGKRLHVFSPYKNDRIYVMEFDDGVKLVLEQFGKGNVVLLAPDGKIVRALRRIEEKGETKMREMDGNGGKGRRTDGKKDGNWKESPKPDTNVRKKSLEFYQFPENAGGIGIVPQEKDWEALADSPKKSLPLESALARWPMGRTYTKEAIERLGLDGRAKIAQVSAQDGAHLVRTLQQMAQNVSPRVYWRDENGKRTALEVSLVPMAKMDMGGAEIKAQEFASWSEALEAYFSNARERKEAAPEDPALVRLKKRMNEQEEALKRIDEEIAQMTKRSAWMKDNLGRMEEKIEETKKKGEKKLELEFEPA